MLREHSTSTFAPDRRRARDRRRSARPGKPKPGGEDGRSGESAGSIPDSASDDGRADDDADGAERAGPAAPFRTRHPRRRRRDGLPVGAARPAAIARASGLEVAASTKTPLPCAAGAVEHRVERSEALDRPTASSRPTSSGEPGCSQASPYASTDEPMSPRFTSAITTGRRRAPRRARPRAPRTRPSRSARRTRPGA